MFRQVVSLFGGGRRAGQSACKYLAALSWLGEQVRPDFFFLLQISPWLHNWCDQNCCPEPGTPPWCRKPAPVGLATETHDNKETATFLISLLFVRLFFGAVFLFNGTKRGFTYRRIQMLCDAAAYADCIVSLLKLILGLRSRNCREEREKVVG